MATNGQQISMNSNTSEGDEIASRDVKVNDGNKDIWSLPIDKLYQWAVEYYKSVKDTLQLKYEDRVQLLAYYKQEKYGMYTPDKDSDVGYFDVVGRHRRKKWQDLGDMSKDDVQRKFSELMVTASDNAFKQWVLQRIAVEEEEAERRRQVELEARRKAEEEERRRIEEERRKEEEKRKQEEQKEQQRLKELEEQKSKQENNHTALPQSAGSSPSMPHQPGSGKESTDGPASPAPPTLWCKPKVADKLRAELGESGNHVLTVARSEMAIVKVETTSEAAGIFWEFCTESYDIGFGLSFKKEGSQIEEELLKVVRRECSEDVIAGTHNFLTTGTYFLKFDNTYSVFRSKKVFYRVYYCKGSEALNEQDKQIK